MQSLHCTHLKAGLCAAVLATLSIMAADAQVYEKLFSFTDANSTALSSNLNRGSLIEAGLVEGGDGNFYGTTPAGGSSDFGTVFRMTPDGVLTTLVQFGSSGNPHDGKNPYSGLALGYDGNFYGTTSAGGTNECGTIFKVTPGGVMTVLASFSGTSGTTKGKNPYGTLALGTDANFYGTTKNGGASDRGTVFKVTPAGAVTTLVEFTDTVGPKKGSAPAAGLLRGSDGYFYGTTEFGGPYSCGTAFKMTSGGVFTTLVEFTAANRNPHANLIQGSDGNYYGTTRNGGVSDNGTAFKLTPAGSLTTLAVFAEATCHPYAGLVQGSDGNFHGTTRGDATKNIAGTVFRMTPGGALTTLITFTDIVGPNKGAWPSANLIRGSDGSLYGTTSLGGTKGWGTIFSITPAGTLKTLVEFDGSGTINQGILPTAGLLQGTDGSFYGTTREGGAYGWGTVFRMTPAGDLTTLVAFTLNETKNKGAYPHSGLILGRDGDLYGTTSVGGSSIAGTIFKMTPDGVLTTMAEFTGGTDGGMPVAGLVQASDGNFYGTTNALGPNGCGTLFRMTPAGGLTTLLAFTGTTGPNKGNGSNSALIQGSDGLFYGTTYKGGVNDLGTIFKVTPAGVLTTLVEFTGVTGPARGALPAASLVLATDGQFYGTTHDGGTANQGTVFKMSPAGVLTTLYEFGFYGGWGPNARLIQGADGNLYGTTTGNTIFKITPGGMFSDIFTLSFDPVDCLLTSNVIFGADGNLYGVTLGDFQAGGAGSVFRLVYPGAPTVFPFKTYVRGQTSAVLQAKVNARGAATTTVIEYGTDAVTFPNTLPVIPNVVNGFQSNLVGNTLYGLTAGTTYYCRFRATSTSGTTVSPVLALATLMESTATPTPATQVQQTSARFNGTVNAQNSDTTVVFEYGTDGNSFPDTVAATPGVVGGRVNTPVSAAVAGLTKGTTCFYRIVATNAAGTTVTGAVSFRTLTEPTATVAGAVPLSTTSARVSGVLNAQGSLTQIVFEYGTDGVGYPNSVAAVPSTADGAGDTPVSAELTNLAQGSTYYYRVKGTSAGGVGTSSAASFQMATLSGLTQVPPGNAPDAQGFLWVNLTPADFPDTTLPPGWRFVGEQLWRPSGIPVGGLTTGNRDLEFRPVPGYIQPIRETVSVVSGAAATVVTAEYHEAAGGGATGGLSVILKPAAVADLALPAAQRAQWRWLGEDDTQWRDSGITLANLFPGEYLVECKPVSGQTTPPPISVSVVPGPTRVATVTYFQAGATAGTLPSVLSFDTVTGSPAMPYGYVGQIRTDLGSSSGFVVAPRVVATAAHVVFDDGTLTYVTGLQWLFERDRGTYEPVPQTPRGFYIYDGYRDQRTADASPGVATPASQHLDAAALYFMEDAGRGGFGGFVASDLDSNEFLQSAKLKLLVGYPVDGITALKQGRMHATPPANVGFAKGYGHTYTTADIRSSGGASGGPLCVQHDNGNYYPAAIYLGGSGQTVVRAIDSQVIELFNRASISGDGGDNNTGGGITHSGSTAIGTAATPGAIKVIIQPAAAAAAGAGAWRLSPETSYRLSGAQKNGLNAGNYILQLKEVSGYQVPAQQTVSISRGQLLELTFTYLENLNTPPSIATVADQSIAVNTATAALPFTVGDNDAPATALTLTTHSSNPTLVPVSNIVLAGSGANRTVTVTPADNQLGSATITLTVSDGVLTTSTSFVLTVTGTAREAWRFANFGTTSNTGRAADPADPDGDGSNNLAEAAAGTDPNNAADVFKVLTAARDATSFTLTAAGKASRTYVLERMAAPGTNSWTAVGSVGPLAADGSVALTDPAAPAGSGIYRLRVSAP
ncbi:MAG: hypothetical protein NTW21_12065 [Verrucomicrobia bacterium]|nr:hypothetical protein [Verrucomicrobiota bacterium]